MNRILSNTAMFLLAIALVACQDPKEPKPGQHSGVVFRHSPALPEDAVPTPAVLHSDDEHGEEIPLFANTNSLPPFSGEITASEIDKSYEAAMQYCDSQPEKDRDDCVLNAQADYEVSKAAVETTPAYAELGQQIPRY